ncbi:MAG: signal recognition particle-docking protein FtsY [Candidatus Woesearchaeota archaeon]
MFGFLKNKLKEAVSKFSKKVDEEGKEEKIEVEKPVEDVKKSDSSKDIKKESPDKEKAVKEKKKDSSKKEKEPTKQKDKPINEIQEKSQENNSKVEQEPSKETEEEFEPEIKEKSQTERDEKENKEIKKVEKETESDTDTEEIYDEKVVQENDVSEKKGFFSRLKDSFTKTKKEEEILQETFETQAEKEEEIEERLDKKTEDKIEKQKDKKSDDEPDSESDESLTQEEAITNQNNLDKDSISQDLSKEITPEIKDNIKKLEQETQEQESIEKDIAEHKSEFKDISDEADKLEKENINLTNDSDKKELKNNIEDIEKTIVKESEDTIKEIQQKQKTSTDSEDELDMPEKKGFFAKIKESITTKKISAKQFEEMFWDIEMALLENSVAVEVIEKIKEDLMIAVVDKPIPRKDVETHVIKNMLKSIENLFDQGSINVINAIEEKQKQKKPYVICFVGVNGSGKTTTIAKFANMLKIKGKTCVLAASDTFRAAAIDQLQIHADKLDVKLIRHDYNADPAAVAFDAIKHAESKNKDVVLIDTAGRLHSNSNLMEELHKIIKVAKPDLTIFLGEAITGNDCIEQAREFDKMVNIDGIILSKADIDEKGGAAISISYVLKKPILYLGVGQNYEDLRQFSPNYILQQLEI